MNKSGKSLTDQYFEDVENKVKNVDYIKLRSIKPKWNNKKST